MLNSWRLGIDKIPFSFDSKKIESCHEKIIFFFIIERYITKSKFDHSSLAWFDLILVLFLKF